MTWKCTVCGHGSPDGFGQCEDCLEKEIERLTADLQAKDKRIAELEKTNAQLNHDIGGYVDKTARLRAVVFAATNVYQWAAPTSELEQADMLWLYDALAAAQEGEGE